jgi:hypothetical protein
MTARELLRAAAEAFNDMLRESELTEGLRTLARRIDEETLAADMMLAANAEDAQWVRNLLARLDAPLDADLEGDAR